MNQRILVDAWAVYSAHNNFVQRNIKPSVLGLNLIQYTEYQIIKLTKIFPFFITPFFNTKSKSSEYENLVNPCCSLNGLRFTL